MNLQKYTKQITSKQIKYTKEKNKYYETNKELLDTISKTKQKPVRHGLLLGTETSTKFKPTLYLIDKLSKTSKNKIYINKKAEWLFICGRDVFSENVIKNKSNKKMFFVQNEEDENLGLGIQDTVKGKKIIKNIRDKGKYLRNE